MDRKEFQDKLVSEFPNLYSQVKYVGVGEGWYDILFRLSEKLERLINLEPESSRSEYYMTQNKEKFGCLRVYMSASTEEMDMAIYAAETESEITCECCGKPGTIQPGNWIKTLCDSCHEKELNK